jgi:uroporphyrinogen decarboxylase
MAGKAMSPAERVETALSFKEPDRVPFNLPVSLKGAADMGLSLKDYFGSSEAVFEAQMKALKLYGHDFATGYFYTASEAEAWGQEVVFYEDGPPNAADPIIRSPEDIEELEVPDIRRVPVCTRSLETTRMLKAELKDRVPIIGVTISPFSLPIMQMGFGPYLDLIHARDRRFQLLMDINTRFTTGWANAQLDAGAGMIVYYDPMSSPTIIPPALYAETGFTIAKSVIPRIKGPTAVHFASGRCLPILEMVTETGTGGVGVSADEDIGEVKRRGGGKLAVMGNLNAIEMRRWDADKAEAAVKTAIRSAGAGGGFVLTDNHGEIPLQVPHEVLEAIAEAVREWGRYPLSWIDES